MDAHSSKKFKKHSLNLFNFYLWGICLLETHIIQCLAKALGEWALSMYYLDAKLHLAVIDDANLNVCNQSGTSVKTAFRGC